MKTCHWTKESLLRDRQCYKGKFYGVASHNCMQSRSWSTSATGVHLLLARTSHGHAGTDRPGPARPALRIRSPTTSARASGATPRCLREVAGRSNPKHVASLNGEPTSTPRRIHGPVPQARHDHDAGDQRHAAQGARRNWPLPTHSTSRWMPPTSRCSMRSRPKWNSGAEQFEKTIDLLPSLDTCIVCRHTLSRV